MFYLKSWQLAKGSWQNFLLFMLNVFKTTLWQDLSVTQVSLDIAEACKYISREEYQGLIEKSEEIGRMLNHMVENPEKYRPKG